MNDFRHLIEQWHENPATAQSRFALDLGLPLTTARSMYERNIINAEHYDDIVKAAKYRKVSGVNHSMLCRLYKEAKAERTLKRKTKRLASQDV